MGLRLGILLLSGILLVCGCSKAPVSQDPGATERAVRERARAVLEGRFDRFVESRIDKV